METQQARTLRRARGTLARTLVTALMIVASACSDAPSHSDGSGSTDVSVPTSGDTPTIDPVNIAPVDTTGSAAATTAPASPSPSAAELPPSSPVPVDVPGHGDRPTLLLRAASDTAPLVVVFHGSRGSIENVQGRSGLDAAATAAGVAVLWLSGKPLPERSWNTNNRCCEPASTERVDDLGYVDTAIETVERLGLRPVRMITAGVSNGAGMAVSTACKRPRVFSAAVSVAGWMPITCRDRNVSLVAISGTEDDVIGRRTAREMATTWRRTVVGCTGDATTLRRGIANISTWVDCAGNTYVRLALLDGVGHVWPRLGDYDATDEIITAATSGW